MNLYPNVFHAISLIVLLLAFNPFYHPLRRNEMKLLQEGGVLSGSVHFYCRV